MEKRFVSDRFCNTGLVLISDRAAKLVFIKEYTDFMESVFKKRYPDVMFNVHSEVQWSLPSEKYSTFVGDLQANLVVLYNNALLNCKTAPAVLELSTTLHALAFAWEMMKILHSEFITGITLPAGATGLPEIWEGSPVVEGPGCFFVLDVESIGLHGEGFAVGFTVVLHDGKTLEEGLLSCPVQEASSRDSSGCEFVPVSANTDGSTSWEVGSGLTTGLKNLKWVNENVPALTITHSNPEGVRNAFWERWLYWRERGAVMVADCAWPVEARFLLACVDEHMPTREWQGPYPLHDLATLLLAQGHNPIGTFKRLPAELPAHNPLCDARQSARILLDLLKNKGLSLPNLK